MEDNIFTTSTAEGQSPEGVITAFCRQYPSHTVVNRIWLWYSLAMKSGKIKEEEKTEFALFQDQLKNLVAAVYNFHQADKASDDEAEELHD